MITDPHDDLGLVGIEKKQPEERVNEFGRSLGNYKAYNPFIDFYYFYLEGMPRSIVLSSLPHYSVMHYCCVCIYVLLPTLVRDASIGLS